MSKKSHLSFKQRLHNAIGCQEIERKKTVHGYLHALSYEREEFDTLWVKSPNATWCHDFGRMVGWDEIYYNHVIDEQERAAQYCFETGKDYPEYRGTDIRSVGSSGVHCLPEGCIEMADDGLSGRCFYLTPGGSYTAADGYERTAAANWEYYGSDFVYHEGQWLYLHEHVCPIFRAALNDKNWGHEMYLKSDDDPGHNLFREPPCRVTDPGPHSANYNVHQPVQHLLWECPEPYVTLDEENTCSPGRNSW